MIQGAMSSSRLTKIETVLLRHTSFIVLLGKPSILRDELRVGDARMI